MSGGDFDWRDEAQSWKAKYQTLKDQTEPALERVKAFKANFGVKEKSDGSLMIDYEKLARGLGLDGWLELRRVGDEVLGVSGSPGEKPKVRVKAA